MTILEDDLHVAADLMPVTAPPRTHGSPTARAGDTVQAGEGHDQAAQQLRLICAARRSNMAITILIVIVSFVMSFVSLSDLAASTAFPGSIGFFQLAWLWPVVIDGLNILATVGIVAFSPYPDQRANRNYYRPG